MRPALWILAFVTALPFLLPVQVSSAASAPPAEIEEIRPGQPGVRPFWNENAHRFIYPPSFDFKAVEGASQYKFRALAQGQEHTFLSAHPWDSLKPVWSDLPEGLVELTVQGVDRGGKVLGTAGQKTFYRSSGFQRSSGAPATSYAEAGRLGLRALFIADHVQHWLRSGGPDPDYSFYCYPAKVEGALVRAMVAYAELAPKSSEAKDALEVARGAADHLVQQSMPRGTPFEFWPPTYSTNVAHPKSAAVPAFAKKWLMTHYPCDAAFGYLDLYRATGERRFLEAAGKIADTYARTQGADGTWPLVVNFETGKEEAPNRLVPTWVVFLFDRLDREHGIHKYRDNRQRAWKYIEENPVRTFAWDAQFEDTKPRAPYRNLAREQACDVATILFEDPARTPAKLELARELLRFGEDQFVVWSPIKDPQAWKKLKLERRLEPQIWITPLVLEQYTCYMPVARSSAVFIKAYLAAYRATREPLFLDKARALATSLVEAQQDQIRNYGGKGEIPTWVVRKEPNNWLNNSFYAAEALVELSRAESRQASNAN